MGVQNASVAQSWWSPAIDGVLFPAALDRLAKLRTPGQEFLLGVNAHEFGLWGSPLLLALLSIFPIKRRHGSSADRVQCGREAGRLEPAHVPSWPSLLYLTPNVISD